MMLRQSWSVCPEVGVITLRVLELPPPSGFTFFKEGPLEQAAPSQADLGIWWRLHTFIPLERSTSIWTFLCTSETRFWGTDLRWIYIVFRRLAWPQRPLGMATAYYYNCFKDRSINMKSARIHTHAHTRTASPLFLEKPLSHSNLQSLGIRPKTFGWMRTYHDNNIL